MAERWGADVIRDSDGTTLSAEILQSGHGIYSTLCLIRGTTPGPGPTRTSSSRTSDDHPGDRDRPRGHDRPARRLLA
ncbi:MAG TPA: 1,3-beta-galactosyl-N-acetylhexosamine phosphorylase N-terminal domain-containing protein [Coriobacteriia bacterium]|nr:1,3-beta-galactosyl-N-acetylhexosamine phosphorylase N-terminal domain-containing protein [Coriobacteriia bacterium]